VNQTQFRFIPHTMVEGFILPEGLPGSAKNQVGWSRGGAFQPTRDHPGSELIKVPSVLAIQESLGHHTGYSGILQPYRPESSFVHFTVQDEKARPADRFAPVGACKRPGSRDGASQTPSDKQEGRLCEIGMPTGKLSAVEHNELAGESAHI
jgi:hypothetical protein